MPYRIPSFWSGGGIQSQKAEQIGGPLLVWIPTLTIIIGLPLTLTLTLESLDERRRS